MNPLCTTSHQLLALSGQQEQKAESCGLTADCLQSGTSSLQVALACLASVGQQGQDKGHAGSLSQPALGFDSTAVGFGYGLCYRETETAAQLPDFGQAVEALEDEWEFGLR